MRDLEPYKENPTPESHKTPYQAKAPYWRRAHTDWKFWVAVFFLFAALFIYIFSYDLVLIPH
jgi:hypothetical protein